MGVLGIPLALPHLHSTSVRTPRFSPKDAVASCTPETRELCPPPCLGLGSHSWTTATRFRQFMLGAIPTEGQTFFLHILWRLLAFIHCGTCVDAKMFRALYVVRIGDMRGPLRIYTLADVPGMQPSLTAVFCNLHQDRAIVANLVTGLQQAVVLFAA